MTDQPKPFEHLFPMRMTSIEKFHWFDDSEEYPNHIFCRMSLTARVDHDLAVQAWNFVVSRQPFADVEPRRIDGKLKWVQVERDRKAENRPVENCSGARFEFHELDEALPDLPEELRSKSDTSSYLGIFQTSKSTVSEIASEGVEDSSANVVCEVWLFVHHAICDGVGGIAVINDWMVVYSNLCEGRAPGKGLHRIDAELLKGRNSIGFWSWRYLKHLWKQPIALFGATKFVLRKTVELLPKPLLPSPPLERRYPAIVGTWIDDEQVQRIAGHAKSHSVMVNSVMLGQLYLALADWRDQQGCHSSTDWLRIILPINIRIVSDRRLPAANRATLVQIDRQESQAYDLGKFYQGLNHEVGVIIGWQLDKIFLLSIRALSIFEARLKSAAKNDKSRGMAVFTNLGQPFRKYVKSAGKGEMARHLGVQSFDLCGPIRRGTPVNYSVSRYRNRLRVSLQYDSSLLAKEDGEELLAIYVERLKAL